VVGYGAIWLVRLDKFRMDLVIDPEWRRRGIGARMLRELIVSAERTGAATLQARAEADARDSLSFLERRRFVETMRMHRLVLRVAEADLAPLAGRQTRLAEHGIGITTLQKEQECDPECWMKLCDLYNDTRSGWPDPDPGPQERLGIDDVRHLFYRAGLIPAEFLIAKQGDVYLGFTGGFGTGVRPAARNQGIATVLKVRAIKRAREQGQATLHSASGNPAMLRVNEKLGYRRVSTEVRLVRMLQGAER
jgi:GNAT superfamily N-acetyltransferase